MLLTLTNTTQITFLKQQSKLSSVLNYKPSNFEFSAMHTLIQNTDFEINKTESVINAKMFSTLKYVNWAAAPTEVVNNELDKIYKDFNIKKVSRDFDMVEYMRNKIIDEELEDPFYVIDVGILKKKVHQWRQLLPRVEPFYALKCNPHPVLIRTLRAMGIGFDCASKSEIATVLNGMQVSPTKIIFANPCKPPTHLRYAKEVGVELMTFDNRPELIKIQKHYPTAKLVLRILADDSSSICRFGSKFGAPPSHIPSLLQAVKDLKLDLVGVSFHVGSGCLSTEAFVDAVRRAHGVFRKAEEIGLPPLQILDIGGGFPGSTDPYPHPSFQDIAKALRGALDNLFPEESGVKLIAEPGRYFAAETHTLAVCVFARRDVTMDEEGNDDDDDNNDENKNADENHKNDKKDDNNEEEEEEAEANHCAAPSDDESVEKPDFLYYVNDGVYGSFNCLIFDHAKAVPFPLKMVDQTGEYTKESKKSDSDTDTDSDNNQDSDDSDSGNVVKRKGDHNSNTCEEEKDSAHYRCKIFGPTCDSFDLIAKDALLPKLEIGDWMYFKEMGAYTVAAGSEFNGFLRPEMYFLDSEGFA